MNKSIELTLWRKRYNDKALVSANFHKVSECKALAEIITVDTIRAQRELDNTVTACITSINKTLADFNVQAERVASEADHTFDELSTFICRADFNDRIFYSRYPSDAPFLETAIRDITIAKIGCSNEKTSFSADFNDICNTARLMLKDFTNGLEKIDSIGCDLSKAIKQKEQLNTSYTQLLEEIKAQGALLQKRYSLLRASMENITKTYEKSRIVRATAHLAYQKIKHKDFVTIYTNTARNKEELPEKIRELHATATILLPTVYTLSGNSIETTSDESPTSRGSEF
ncbi:MAG: hypothetical protein Q7V63_04220 [Gammaproteobacteria bacterium]|nr:hypothetical protein [Gammaproteobacteria bacterium]